MNVFGVSSTQGMQGVGAVQGTEASTVSAHRGVGDVHDAVDLSVEGVRAADSVVDIRFDRVSAIRTAIAAGTRGCSGGDSQPSPPRSARRSAMAEALGSRRSSGL